MSDAAEDLDSGSVVFAVDQVVFQDHGGFDDGDSTGAVEGDHVAAGGIAAADGGSSGVDQDAVVSVAGAGIVGGGFRADEIAGDRIVGGIDDNAIAAEADDDQAADGDASGTGEVEAVGSSGGGGAVQFDASSMRRTALSCGGATVVF